ncbi:MAG: hypothetical protein JWN44_3872 [Myxococcales bacterium]|nr:hypothetical protein [Myxococcales bacterium]
MPGEDACARCGLLVARWDGYATEDPSHPALEQPWKELESQWEDESAHAKLLQLAAAVDALDVAAAMYRKRKLASPEDARAQWGLERAVGMAQTLYVAKAKAERPPRAPVILKLAGTLFAGFILIAALWAVVLVFRNHNR